VLAKTSGTINNHYTSQLIFVPSQKFERERGNQTSQHLKGLDDHDLIAFDSLSETTSLTCKPISEGAFLGLFEYFWGFMKYHV